VDGQITNSVDVRFIVSAHLGMPQRTKKRRILWIVVSLHQSLLQWLMLLDYQMELNFASGLLSIECCKIRNMMPQVINFVEFRILMALVTTLKAYSVFCKRFVMCEHTGPCHKLGT
jgi:hypothetical protein